MALRASCASPPTQFRRLRHTERRIARIDRTVARFTPGVCFRPYRPWYRLRLGTCWEVAAVRGRNTVYVERVNGRERVLGIPFFNGSAREAVEAGLRGGLVVAPAAPALVDLERDACYRQALVQADLVIPDSGLMVLAWRMLGRERLTRVSGLEYLNLLLEEPALRASGAVCWIMPNESACARNVAWLRIRGFATTKEDCYVAPLYGSGPVSDSALVQWIQRRRPQHIIVALAGGVQERLGLHLRERLDYSPGIHCTGAAISFLSGEQVAIPTWADFFYLGWLLRCLSNPTKFVPRYARAGRLVPLLWKFRGQLPGAA